jgi:hypothetical protein
MHESTSMKNRSVGPGSIVFLHGAVIPSSTPSISRLSASRTPSYKRRSWEQLFVESSLFRVRLDSQSRFFFQSIEFRIVDVETLFFLQGHLHHLTQNQALPIFLFQFGRRPVRDVDSLLDAALMKYLKPF